MNNKPLSIHSCRIRIGNRLQERKRRGRVSPTIESLCTGKDVQLEEALNFIHLQMRDN